MKHIVFEYRDEYTRGEWREQECTVSSLGKCIESSLGECIKIYGPGYCCEYRIILIEEVD